MFLQSTIKFLVSKILDATLPEGYKVNPRALEFVLHYISGKQTNMFLTKDEINATRFQILHDMFLKTKDQYNDVTVMHEVFSSSSEDVVLINKRRLPEAVGYLVGKTHGLVGGFDMYVDSMNCKCICWDTWDFNNLSEELEFKINNKYVNVVKRFLSMINLSYDMTEGKDVTTFTVLESVLSQYNENHAFRTEWEVDMTGACCSIDRYAFKIQLSRVYSNIMDSVLYN